MKNNFEETMNMIQQDSYFDLAKKSISLLNNEKRKELLDYLEKHYNELEAV